MKKARLALFFAVTLLLAVMALGSCSTRKNNAATRNYQAFITRYNIYFNGDEHFKETLKEMEQKYEDDYTRTLLLMHPAEAKVNPKLPQPTGSFDRSIEKAQKAIQLRSIKKRPPKKPGRNNDPEYKAWMQRSEYNPFLHNAWMMMGRSQYYNGDFAGAASTFMYIAKHFTWLPQTVTEARLWEARSYCAIDWLFEAEALVKRVKEEDLTTDALRELYYFTRADIEIRSRQPEALERAIPLLQKAIDYTKGDQKTRLTFLLGQLYEATGNPTEAYKAFRAVGGKSSASYRTQFNARIKQSEVFQGSDISSEVKSLERMARTDRNKEYLDQIYYAIGNLYLSRGDTLRAIENYKQAAEKSTRNGIEKAVAQLALGALYFDRHQYDLAQPCYSEAVPLISEDYPDYKTLKRRSDVLDELAVYAGNVTLQDSLLRLAAMPEADRLKVIDGIIEELKKKEKEEAENAQREEYLAQAEAAGNNLQDNGNAPTQFQLNTDDSWYFYNTTAKNAGKTDFQRRWGSRRLEDNWRRRNKSSFSMDDFSTPSLDDDEEDGAPNDSIDTADAEEKDPEQANRENDPHYPEYYLKQIPSTEEEIQTSHDIIQEGLFNMGIILKDKMGDMPAAAEELNRLLERYPDNVYRLDAYYALYMLWQQVGDATKAEHYRQLILTEFPDSPYGIAMKDPRYLDNLRTMQTRQEELYNQAYEAYIDNRNAEVHAAYDHMQSTYPLSPLMPKFMFIHALAFVPEQKPDTFAVTLKQMLERYPDTDMTPLVSSWLKGMTSGRELSADGRNMRGMLWDTRLTNDTTATGAGAADAGPIEFTLDPNAPHDVIFLFDIAQIQPNALLYNVARFNFTSFMVRDFDIELRQFGTLGLVVVKGFRDEAEAIIYRDRVASDPESGIPLREVRLVVISNPNFDMMLTRGASFEQYFEFTGETLDREVHEEVLPPTEYPSADEMYAPEPTIEPKAEPTPAPEATTKPTTTPTPVPAPHIPTPTPPAPVPVGSEGDDPLLDN